MVIHITAIYLHLNQNTSAKGSTEHVFFFNCLFPKMFSDIKMIGRADRWTNESRVMAE